MSNLRRLFATIFTCLGFSILAALILALCTHIAAAQSSSGYTYYRIAGPTTVDSTGATLTGSPNGSRNFKTDGTNVLFSSYNGGADYPYVYCSADRILYKSTVTGGAPVPLVTTNSKVEVAQPSGTTVNPCDAIALFNGTAYYGANYPAVNPTRSGYFHVPLAGGTSTDFVATGDTTSTGTANIVYNGASYTSNGYVYNYPLDISNLANAVVQAEYFTPTTGASVVSTTAAGATTTSNILNAVSCNGFNLASPAIGSAATDGNGLYAAFTSAFASGKPSRTVISATTNPSALSCSDLIFDPAPNGVNTLLPGEPAQYATTTLANAQLVGFPTVYNNTVYFSAYRYETDGTYFTAIYSYTNGVLSVFLNNRNSYSGVLPTYATLCNGAVDYPFFETPLVAGKYLVFYAEGETQNCSTQAYTTTGGYLWYDLTAKTFNIAAPANTVLVAGDPAYLGPTGSTWAVTPGVLSADGHLLLGSIPTFDTAGYPASTIVYSVYLAQQVTAASLAVTPATSAYAGSITLTSKVTPNTVAATATKPAVTAGGTVSFYDSATLLGTASIDSTGTATLTTNALLAGSHTLTANYIGDPNFMGATSAPVVLPVTKATTTTTLAVSPVTSAPIGTAVTLTGTLTTQQGGTPTGSLVFSDAGKVIATVPLTTLNNAVYMTSTLAAGPHSFTVAYLGDTNFLTSTSVAASLGITLPATVTPIPAASSFVYGQPVGYTIGVTGNSVTPTGTITYTVDAGTSQTATIASTGTAALSLTGLAAGTHKLAYLYSGDTTYTAATTPATTTFTVTPAPLTVTVAPATRAYGGANPTFTAPITGLVYADPITATTATTATATSAPGAYPITATLVDPSSKLANYTVTNTPSTLTITKAADTLTAVIPPTAGVGSTVTLTATAASSTSGVPSGMVTFTTGQTTLGTATLNAAGTAAFPISTLALGTYPITVSYLGDSNFIAAPPVTSTLIIGTPDFSLTATPASATLNAGQTATFQFSVTPVFGYSTTIPFACSGLPANTTCTFSPSSVTPNGAPVTSTLTIATNVTTGTLNPMPLATRSGTAIAFATLFLLAPLFSGKARRKLHPRLLTLLVLLAMGGTLTALSGCGGSGSTGPKTPDGTYTIVVTAGGATGSHAANLSVTVNN